MITCGKTENSVVVIGVIIYYSSGEKARDLHEVGGWDTRWRGGARSRKRRELDKFSNRDEISGLNRDEKLF
jgi:hypothetical protein